MEIIAPHLADAPAPRGGCAVVDLTELDPAGVEDLLHRQVIAVPLLVRVVLALAQNGLPRVILRWGPGQAPLRERFGDDPRLRRVARWLAAGDAPPDCGGEGLYLVAPRCLVNGLVLAALDRAVQGAGPAELYAADPRGRLLWVPPATLAAAREAAPGGWTEWLRRRPARRVTLDDPGAAMLWVAGAADTAAAERLLCEEVTRKKGGWIAKRLNEPVSLWIARRLAPTPVTPNQITLVNGLLGLLSALLVILGARRGAYWPLAAGGLLFYAVDIFDGIDGELARLTFRSSPRGALYDTLGDNLTVAAFLAAVAYAAHLQVPHWSLPLAAALALGGFTAVVLYLAWFTQRHYGHVQLRLYETRFMAGLPRDRPLTRAILAARHLYTKDIYTALMAVLVVAARPAWVIYLAAGYALAAAWGYTYLGLRYGGPGGARRRRAG